MVTRKFDNLLRLLAEIDRLPQSGPALAEHLGVSLPTVARMVAELRELGCHVEAVRDGGSWGYRLLDWGVFDASRVRRFVQDVPVISAA